MAKTKVVVPKVYESFDVGEVKPMKDYDVLIGIADVILDGKDHYQCFICQGESGKQGAALDNKFDKTYLDKVAESRGKKLEEDAEGIVAGIEELNQVKPPIEDKVMEKWKEVAKNLDFKPGGTPKMEGELAEMWAKKPKAEKVETEPLDD